MRNQTTAHAGAVIRGPRTEGLAGRVLDEGSEVADLGQHPIATISAAVLITARQQYRQSRPDFAARAGVAPEVVEGAEDGTRPAWALPYSEFTALAVAVSALDPALRDLFEVGAACDLLVSCVLDGDQAFATDVLVRPGWRELARSLLPLAIKGESAADLTAPEHAKLFRGRVSLTAGQAGLLQLRAAALACSGLPDAWVGAEIAAVCRGERR